MRRFVVGCRCAQHPGSRRSQADGTHRCQGCRLRLKRPPGAREGEKSLASHAVLPPVQNSTRAFVALSAVAVLLAACTGSGETAETTQPSITVAPPITGVPDTTAPQPDTTVQENTTTTESGEPIITIAGFSFNGPEAVPVGTTIMIENEDSAAHTWTSVDDVFDSDTLGRGDRFEFTFDTPGEYQYFCRIHPSMEGSIKVEG